MHLLGTKIIHCLFDDVSRLDYMNFDQ